MIVAQEHPAFIDKTPEQVALEHCGANVEAFDRQVDVLRRTLTLEYQDRLRRFFERFKAICVEKDKKRYDDAVRKSGGKPVEPIACTTSLMEEALDDWLWTATLYDFDISEDDVARVEWDYGPWNVLDPDRAGWPTKGWFRYAQRGWLAVQWDLVPDFPSTMLVMAGYRLAGSSRYCGDLTDDEIGELMLLQRLFMQRKATREQQVALNALLERCPYGGQLPIFDIDASIPKGLSRDEAAELARRNGQTAVRYAMGISRLWRDLQLGKVQWCVTNRKGGLHGVHPRLPPHYRGVQSLRAVARMIRKKAKDYGIAILDTKTEVKDRVETVNFDLSPYEKDPGGRGGVWRLPGCRKADPESLPQEPIARRVHEMPWLRPLVEQESLS